MPASRQESTIADALRKQWTRLILRNIHFAGRYRRLDALYAVRDPWDMSTDAQRFRFQETNRLIEERFGHVGRMLEVGCGEGHQSEQLLKICDDLVGVDVSKRAVERARDRCPEATFVTGDFSGPELASYERFDLVVACEVLYYVKDVPSALVQMEKLGRACVVTYYSRPAEALDRYVLGIPGVESSRVEYEGSRWTVAWWQAQEKQVGAATT